MNNTLLPNTVRHLDKVKTELTDQSDIDFVQKFSQTQMMAMYYGEIEDAREQEVLRMYGKKNASLRNVYTKECLNA